VRFALALPAQYAALGGAATLGAIVAALSAAAGLYYAARIDITEDDATVLLAANSFTDRGAINHEKLFEKTNEVRKSYALKPLDNDGFKKSLISLGNLGCIEQVSIGTYKLIEKISLKNK
jgi:hypothetical protein